MKTLDRKLARELYRSKGLLLAIASIIAVGMTCFVSFRSAYHNLQHAKTRYYRQCRMADFWIDLKKAPLAEIETLRRIPGITQITPRIGFFATVDLENVVRPINSLVLSLPDRRQAIVNDIVQQEGDYFTTRRRNEVIVNAAFARRHRLYPGSRIHLLLNNRREELLVIGTAISSEFTYLLGPGAVVPDPDNFGVFYVKQSYAEDVFDFNGAANQVVGRLAPNAGQRAALIVAEAERRLEPFGVFTTVLLKNQPSNLSLSSEIAGLGATATVVPAVFMLVAAVVLNVLMTRLARQQRTVIGTLKALGYTDWQIFAHFMKFGLSVGLIGGVCGSGLGYLASMGMMAVYRNFFEFPELASGFFWYTHAIGLLVSLICAVLGSMHGARSMLRLQPAEAMRPEPPRAGGHVLLEKCAIVWRHLATPWRISLRDMARHRLRTGAGLFAAAMGSGLMVTGFMLAEIQSYLIDFQFRQIARSDLTVSFQDEQGRPALDEVKRLPGVDRCEPVLNLACTLVHGRYRRKGGITGLQAGATLTMPRDQSGHPIAVPRAGLVLTSRLAEILHVRRGDRVTLVPIKGERRPFQCTVRQVAESYVGLEAYANIGYLSRKVDAAFVMTGVQITDNHMAADRRRLYRALKQMPAVQTVTSRADMVRNLEELLVNNQYVFITALVIFSGIVFLGSIVNASLVSLAERRREVATFMAIGYGPWQVGAMFLRENLVVNGIGAVLGLPFGYGLIVLTSLAYRENEMFRLPVVSAPWVWALTLALAGLFAMMAHGIVQRQIHRMNYVEALKVKE